MPGFQSFYYVFLQRFALAELTTSNIGVKDMVNEWVKDNEFHPL